MPGKGPERLSWVGGSQVRGAGLLAASFQAGPSPGGLVLAVGSRTCPWGWASKPVCAWSLSALQVEGAFVQGLGLFTMEELHYSPNGVLHTRGPSTYKIPAFGSIPTEFRVSLLRDCPNKKAIYASKVLLPWAWAAFLSALWEAMGGDRGSSHLPCGSAGRSSGREKRT